ncbi:hypothetical protein IMSAGC022_01025 [Alistipes sp.]|nr:hypothetical protein IMSAGC022_01025 [Alistipes sp.]
MLYQFEVGMKHFFFQFFQHIDYNLNFGSLW